MNDHPARTGKRILMEDNLPIVFRGLMRFDRVTAVRIIVHPVDLSFTHLEVTDTTDTALGGQAGVVGIIRIYLTRGIVKRGYAVRTGIIRGRHYSSGGPVEIFCRLILVFLGKFKGIERGRRFLHLLKNRNQSIKETQLHRIGDIPAVAHSVGSRRMAARLQLHGVLLSMESPTVQLTPRVHIATCRKTEQLGNVFDIFIIDTIRLGRSTQVRHIDHPASLRVVGINITDHTLRTVREMENITDIVNHLGGM